MNYPNGAAQQRFTGLGVRQGVRIPGASESRTRLGPAPQRRLRVWAQSRRHWEADIRQVPESARSNASSRSQAPARVKQAREHGHYTGRDVHHHDDGARYRARMSQKGDFGYKATSVLLGESGLALALDRDELSDLRGVLTPAAAMGDALLARFPAAGVSLETSRLD